MPSQHIEHRENLVTEVVAHFDGDFACCGSCERLAGGSVEGRPDASSISVRSARLSLYFTVTDPPRDGAAHDIAPS